MQYRHEARQALARAKALLSQGDDHALRYAALELRLTLEAGVFDRLHDYRRDVPPTLYETWQPRKVLRLLLEVDPDADQPSTVRLTRQSEDGAAPSSVAFSETPIDRFTLKGNYDALGNYLHMPTIKQINTEGGPDFAKLRNRCEALIAQLDPMVTPPKTTFIGGRFSHCACTRCGADMRKRLPRGVTGELAAVCQGCEAPYRLFIGEDDPDRWTAVKYAAPCGHDGCGLPHGVIPDELKEGYRWRCEACDGENVYDCAIFPLPPSDRPDQASKDGAPPV
jgi:hypothetical protein